MSEKTPRRISGDQMIVAGLVAFIVVLILAITFRFGPPPPPPLPDCSDLIAKRLNNIQYKIPDELIIPEECATLAPGGTIPPSYSPPNKKSGG